MGRELFYCGRCGVRLSGDDFAGGGAVRMSDAEVLCRGCAPPPCQVPAIAAARPAVPSTTRRQAPASAAPSPSRTREFWIAGSLLAAGVLVALVLMPKERPMAAPPTSASVPPPPRPNPDDGRQGRMSDALGELNRTTQEAVAKEEYGKAVAAWENARSRFDSAEWRSHVDEAVGVLRKRAKVRWEELKGTAPAADRKALRERVKAWGFPELTKEVEAWKSLEAKGLWVKSGKRYEWFVAKPGERLYIDRTHVITSLPDFLKEAIALRGANDDKGKTDSPFLRFEVSEDADVYVTLDPRNKEPKWLLGWERQPMTLGMSDRALTLYRKRHKAGRVELGGPSSPQANSYVIFVTPPR
jgi:hypothetical protein